MRRDRYTDPRLDEPEGYIDENGVYRDSGDYTYGPQGGPILWGALLVAILATVGAFGWGMAQAFRLLEKLLGL